MTHNHRRGTQATALGVFAVLALTGCTDDNSPSASTPPAAAASPASDGENIASELAALENEFDARIGVSALDADTGLTVTYRADERFGYASTLKVFAAAEILRQLPADEQETVVNWTQKDVEAAGYSPVTTENLDNGLTFTQLAEAAVRSSDNTAMNLIVKRIGGPAGLDEALDLLGDTATNVVNDEPDLNEIEPGSVADTTTPQAFTSNLAALLDDTNLSPSDEARLVDWMSANATGDALVRAGAPGGWVVSDKSGGAGAIRNDVAIVTPPGKSPIVLTIFTVKNDPAAKYDDALVARSAAAVLAAFE